MQLFARKVFDEETRVQLQTGGGTIEEKRRRHRRKKQDGSRRVLKGKIYSGCLSNAISNAGNTRHHKTSVFKITLYFLLNFHFFRIMKKIIFYDIVPLQLRSLKLNQTLLIY